MKDIRTGFIGTGKMASALACGFSRTLVPASQIVGVDPEKDSRTAFAELLNNECTTGTEPEMLESADVVFLAVKPGVMKAVIEQYHRALSHGQLIVSIAAGTRIETMESLLPDGARLIRVMPNTPCLAGQGACGVSRGTLATPEDEDLVCELLASVGIVERVPERLLDAVTGLSGCGPAYVFQIIEALSDGGVKVGLPRTTATRLAAQTLLGAAKMVLESGDHPGSLKDAVTSPGGATIAAIHAMEQAGVRAGLMDAVESGTLKSIELG